MSSHRPLSARFITSCVLCGDGDAINAMMDKARPITYRTFARHMGRHAMRELARQFKYDLRRDVGLTIAQDWAVGYYRGRWAGEKVLIFQHSRIEYIYKF